MESRAERRRSRTAGLALSGTASDIRESPLLLGAAPPGRRQEARADQALAQPAPLEDVKKVSTRQVGRTGGSLDVRSNVCLIRSWREALEAGPRQRSSPSGRFRTGDLARPNG